MSHFVKLLDKNKIAYNTDDEWLLITIDKKKLSTKYVSLVPYYLTDTNAYDEIEDVTPDEAIEFLTPKLKKLYTPEQLTQITIGLKDRLEVDKYSDPTLTAEQMFLIRLGLSLGVPTTSQSDTILDIFSQYCENKKLHTKQ